MTTRDDILRMAREAGFITGTRDYADGDGAMPFVQSVATGTFLPELERFHALATERERTARQAAQSENEELKARIARTGLVLRTAVWAMRERCAQVCDEVKAKSRQHLFRSGAAICAGEIRALKDQDEPDLRPSDTYTPNCPTGLRSGQQLETLVTTGNTPPTTPTP